jgi:hypothetical protein
MYKFENGEAFFDYSIQQMLISQHPHIPFTQIMLMKQLLPLQNLQ